MNSLYSRFKIGFLVVFLAIVSHSAAYADDLLGIDGESHSGVGVYIKDISTGDVLISHNAERCLTPASITKVYTSASAMSLLGRNFRFKTSVYYTGEIDRNGTLDGNIIVKASGDPTLESEHFKSNSGFIARIIQALNKAGITAIRGDIVQERVNPAHQYKEGPVDTWCINDVGWVYGAGVFDFNWCDNYFGIYPATGRTTSPVPHLKYDVWTTPWTTGLDMVRGVYSDSLIIMGAGYKTDKKARVNTSMPYPFDTFRERLITRLREADIAVTIKSGASSDDKKLLCTHSSPVLDEILHSMMVRSDNMFAEGMLKVLGDRYGDRYASLEAENNLWKSRGLHPEYNRILDGSGLSRANAISPHFLGDVLEWMAKSEMSSRFVSLFPVAGVDGTMKNFLKDTPFKGKLALKTGSVNAVQTYAGYLKGDDGAPTHVVVIMVNNFYCTRAQLREAIKELLLNTLIEN